MIDEYWVFVITGTVSRVLSRLILIVIEKTGKGGGKVSKSLSMKKVGDEVEETDEPEEEQDGEDVSAEAEA